MRFSAVTSIFFAAVASAQIFGSTGNTNPGSDAKVRRLNVTAGVEFLDSSPLGVKILSGEQTRTLVKLTNLEEKPVVVEYVGGSLWNKDNGKSVKNLTSIKLGTQIKNNQKIEIPYSFRVELLEQDLLLNLALIATTGDGELVTITAFNQTVSVVEPEVSILDPQNLFLYLILASALTGIVYFIYNTWVASVVPKHKRKSEQKPALVAAASTSESQIDESWIPEHHLKKTAKSKGAPKSKAKN